jgi:hypothetical protein
MLRKMLRDNFSTALAVLTGAVAIVLQPLGYLDQKYVPTIILSIITLIATAELVDKSRRLDRIESTLDQGFADLRRSAGDVEVFSFTTAADAFKFMSEAIRTAMSTIDHAALAPSVPRWSAEHEKYENAIGLMLHESKVRYRYLAELPEGHRRERIRRYQSDKAVRQFFVRKILSTEPPIRLHNFMIFDERLVIMNYPYAEGEPERFLAIRNNEVVAFYCNLFNTLWTQALPVSAKPTAK